MRRLIPVLAAATLFLLCAAIASADEFGLKGLDLVFENQDGSPAMQAGSHPFALTNTIEVNTSESGGKEFPVDQVKDLVVDAPPGLVADRGAVPTCSSAVFLESTSIFNPPCPNETVLGIVHLTLDIGGGGEREFFTVPLYNLIPPPGKVLKLGFIGGGVPVTLEAALSEEAPYHGVLVAQNIVQAVSFFASKVSLWGDPSSPGHDAERGTCVSPKVAAR